MKMKKICNNYFKIKYYNRELILKIIFVVWLGNNKYIFVNEYLIINFYLKKENRNNFVNKLLFKKKIIC